jgi:S-adenosylmethionine hydrolase
MKKILFIIIGLFILSPIFSQEEPQKITIRKESNLAKASYDNVDYKLIAQDKYGNIVNHAVKSFELHYRINNKKIKMMISYSESLTPEMLEEFKKLKEAKKIFFTKIMAEDEFGNVVRLPDVIEVQFPDCKIKQNLKKQ